MLSTRGRKFRLARLRASVEHRRCVCVCVCSGRPCERVTRKDAEGGEGEGYRSEGNEDSEGVEDDEGDGEGHAEGSQTETW